MTVLRIRRRRLRSMKMVALGVIGISIIGSVAGCSMFHSNIKGGFACSAPDGSCAPTNVIDDAALRQIRQNERTDKGGNTGDMPVPMPGSSPSGSVQENVFVPANQIGKDGHLATAIAGRALRVVYPAHADATGKLVPKTIAYAVVDLGDWGGLRTEPVLTLDGKVSTKVSRGLLGAAENAPDLMAIAPASAPAPALAANTPAPLKPHPPASVASAPAQVNLGPIEQIKAEADKILAAGKTKTAGTFTPSGN